MGESNTRGKLHSPPSANFFIIKNRIKTAFSILSDLDKMLSIYCLAGLPFCDINTTSYTITKNSNIVNRNNKVLADLLFKWSLNGVN
jgi:hypothetical protein